MFALIKDIVISILIFSRKKPYIVKVFCFYLANFIMYITRFYRKKYPCIKDVYLFGANINNFFRLPLFIEDCYVKTIIRNKVEYSMKALFELNKLLINNSKNTHKYLSDFFHKIQANEAFVSFFEKKKVKSHFVIYGKADRVCSDDPVWFAINMAVITIKDVVNTYIDNKIVPDGIEIYKYYFYGNRFFNDLFILETNHGFLCLLNSFASDSIYPSIRKKLVEEDVAKIFAIVNGLNLQVVFIRSDVAKVLDSALGMIKLEDIKCMDKLYYII